MKRVVAIVVVLIGCTAAMPASAQDREEGKRSLTKILVGASAVAVGVTVAAKSSDSTTVTSALGTTTTSSFSTSQLITGLSIAGVGGIVLWDGLRTHDRNRSQPSTRVVAGVGAHARMVGLQHVW